MTEFLESVLHWIVSGEARIYIRAVTIVAVGYLMARLVRRWIRRKQLNPQAQMIAARLAGYLVMTVALVWALRELGFQLGALLGAAGLFTVALGFAARTSVSNLISGLFLVGERPFVVGDCIQVGTVTGFVLSVDLMSVKLRTYDNLLVRIPNESLFKKDVTNLSFFPIRRYDLKIGVAYKESLSRVKKVLDEVADKNPLCLVDPAPVFIFLSYGDSGLQIQYSVWAKRELFPQLKTSITREVKDAFDAQGIEIPFPHRSLYTGSLTAPFPIRVVPDPPEAAPADELGAVGIDPVDGHPRG
ncbi:MAG: mechanosensitive ion channel family protein [bacterium]